MRCSRTKLREQEIGLWPACTQAYISDFSILRLGFLPYCARIFIEIEFIAVVKVIRNYVLQRTFKEWHGLAANCVAHARRKFHELWTNHGS